MRILNLIKLIIGVIVISCSSDIPEDTSVGSIAGTVSDITTGEPLSNVTVSLSPGGSSTVTGSDGSFSYSNITPGVYTLSIRKEGYNPSSITASVKGGETTPIHITLGRIPASLKSDKTILDFGDNISQLSFSIVNTGYTNLEYTVETGQCTWLSTEPKSGTIGYGKTTTIIVKIDRTKLPEGDNEANIVVHSSSGDGNVEIKVRAINRQSTSSVNTLPPTNIESNSATLCGEITQVGEPKYKERGFVYSDKSTPSIEDCIQKLSSPVNENAEFSCNIHNLTALSTYYVRAYVVQGDSVIYGNVVSFTTTQQVTVVMTSAATNVSATSATLNGTISKAGTPAFTERGFCYSTNSNPTISDNKVAVAGNSVGDFSVTRYGLSYPTTYYVRAYAIQSGSVVYGNIVSFTTFSTPVSVTTSAASQITSTSAILNGSIGVTGIPPYNERGFCLTSQYKDPTISDTRIIISGNGVAGNFSTKVENLNYDTDYRFRAYAIQNGKPTYGSTLEFSTMYTKASVVTMDASNIKYTTARFNGSVTNVGDPTITERGFCYSTNLSNNSFNYHPSISDKKIKVNGLVGGNYTADVSNLEEDETYYVRAYVIQNGEAIYGDAKRVDMGYEPVVYTGPAYNVKVATTPYWQASFQGQYLEGSPQATEAGFIYSTSGNPIVGNGTIVRATEPVNITPPTICSHCHPDTLFSARRHTINSGRTLTTILLKQNPS